jgi:hypothetical protein
MATLENYGTMWHRTGSRTASTVLRPNGESCDPDTLAFVGRMDYYESECMFDFCARVLPLVRAKRPGLKLMIVSAIPPSSASLIRE